MSLLPDTKSTVDTLLQLVPEHPGTVMSHLERQPEFANIQDFYGYSLLHAATSYNKLDLLRALALTYKVDVNIRDNDKETPLFAAETLEAARCLVEELKADITAQNEDGVTAEENARENIVDGAEWGAVASYLEGVRNSALSSGSFVHATDDHAIEGNGENAHVRPPPPLPPNVHINIGTIEDPSTIDGDPDPEIRRQIEELAAREDFQSEDGQERLRQLVSQIVGELSIQDDEREVRPRTDSTD